MIFRLFRRDPTAGTIDALYGAIVAQARNPAFYLAYGAPDTAEGRPAWARLSLSRVTVLGGLDVREIGELSDSIVTGRLLSSSANTTGPCGLHMASSTVSLISSRSVGSSAVAVRTTLTLRSPASPSAIEAAPTP